MIKIEVPGRFTYEIENAVFDYNGTIASNGSISQGVREKINELSKLVNIYVLTADTYGSAAKECSNLNLKLLTFPKGNAADFKANIVSELSGDKTICFGNGYNDIKMFEKALLKVAVLGDEGMCSELLFKSDIMVKSIEDGINLLLNTNAFIADLRG